MTKLVRKIAAMSAAVMMMASMSIGASASGPILDRDANYNGTYMRMAVQGNIYTGTYKRRFYNLTTSRSSTKRYFTVKAEIQNNSKKTIGSPVTKNKVLSLGNILVPELTMTNKSAAYGYGWSQVRKTNKSNSAIIEKKPLYVSLKY